MTAFKDIVSKVSSIFIEEASQSPHLLSDMAKMEYYMAESYSGRVLIELLQNADDAQSSKVLILIKGNNVYFANNGRPFDENDLIAISRSGASGKERGKTIGYRGIGFKSTSYISNDIVIHSNDAYFTFSKSLCAYILRVSENDVPTIRIPISLEKPEQNLIQNIEALSQQGYTTIFVFKDANIQALYDEIDTIGIGHFLFLNSITECIVKEDAEIRKSYNVFRSSIKDSNVINYKADNESQNWLIFKKNEVSVAFLTSNGMIVPCPEDDAVYHCFLPTLDKSIIRCKINADFSTDPSRKHLTIDDKTKSSLNIVADILFDVLKKAVQNTDSSIYKNICSTFINKNLLSRVNQLVDDVLESNIINNKWLILNNGTKISPKSYNQFPITFDIDSSLTLRTISGKLREESLPVNIYKSIDNIDDFLCQYSQNEFSVNDIITQLEDEYFVKSLNQETHIQLLTNTFREIKIKSSLSHGFKYSIGNILIKTETQEIRPLKSIPGSNIGIDATMKKELIERLGNSELMWLQEKIGYPIFISVKNKDQRSIPELDKSLSIGDIGSVSPYILKWRDAESKCVEIEKISGNTATDVSLRNLGYDVISQTPDGKIKYIEVKSVKKDYSFSLTNNEYTAAHQYGKDYYVCLLCEDEKRLNVRYIQDPLHSAKFEKRIKQWEWSCVGFESTLKTFELE